MAAGSGYFVARAQELGAEVIVLNAYNDNEEQIRQVGYLIEQGIDILVIIPHDAEKAPIRYIWQKKQE